MTVKELIDELSSLEPDAEVIVEQYYYDVSIQHLIIGASQDVLRDNSVRVTLQTAEKP